MLHPVPSGARDPERDEIFRDARAAGDFRFDAGVARVFDDMVERSVPYYAEMQRMVCEIAGEFAVPGSRLYDLGCSTGTTLLQLDRTVKPGVSFVGVDNSAEMLERARSKLDAAGMQRDCELLCADLHQGPHFDDASVATLILTLQFMRPLYRGQFLRRVAEGLRSDGCLLLVEKLTCSDTLLNRLFIRFYYDFKRRNGYTEMEIAQKREALENVLIPYRPEENRRMLHDAGFRHVEDVFRWYNFSVVMALK